MLGPTEAISDRGTTGRRTEARTQLAALAGVQVLVMSVWFSASAVVPQLTADWGLSPAGAAQLTGAVQLGFVVGAIASVLTRLADRVPAPTLLAASGMAAALCNAAFAMSDGLTSALVFRFLTGACLAGVYPVGMKLMSTWFNRDRGLALGLMIGALALGSNVPPLLRGVIVAPWQVVVLTSSLLAALAAILAVLLLRPGPHEAPTPPLFRGALTELVTSRPQRLINLGYVGHMWELYALWAWFPGFMLASNLAHGSPTLPLTSGLTAFLALGVFGAVGCVVAGLASRVRGPAPVARVAVGLSAACCLASPLLYGAPPALLVAFGCVWGAAVIADSGQFSTALSRVVDPSRLGTAMTAQTAVGYTITMVTIQAVPSVTRLLGDRYSLVLLAIGPLVAFVALTRLISAHEGEHP